MKDLIKIFAAGFVGTLAALLATRAVSEALPSPKSDEDEKKARLSRVRNVYEGNK